MKRYIEHIRENRTPHERRQHAMQGAGILTAAVFVVWLTTLGVRLASQTPQVSQNSGSDNQTQLANVASGVYAPDQPNMLQVASTTDTGQ